MSIFDKITKGITRGISNAVSNATQKAVEKKANEILAPKINHAADTIAGRVAQSNSTATNNQNRQASSMQGSLNNLQTAMGAYATKVAQDVKVCSKCNTMASADKKYCPECGELLPETTLAQGSVCSVCGKQNSLAEKFCSNCGAKLPQTVQSEQKQINDDLSVLKSWDEKLSSYPKWECGGSRYCIDEYDNSVFVFSAMYKDYEQARSALNEYKSLLLNNGFTPAGQYPSEEHLYKMIDDICYHADLEHCFESDPNILNIAFDKSEPSGGFDYQEQPKKKKGLFGLFK